MIPRPEMHDTIVVEPDHRFRGLSDLWDYRELVLFLSWRDVKVRYHQTVLGVAWAVVRPVSLMLVFTFFVSRLGRDLSGDVPYAVFTFVALVPWMLLSETVTSAANSLVGNAPLITKVYFPRLALPIASSGKHVLDFLVSSLALMILIFYFDVGTTPRVLWTVPLTVLTVVVATGFGAGLAAANVRYRDVKQGLAFFTQVWLFASPIPYPLSIVPEPWRPVYALNPVVGLVESFRWAWLPGWPMPTVDVLAASAAGAILMVLGGGWYFLRVESRFADVI